MENQSSPESTDVVAAPTSAVTISEEVSAPVNTFGLSASDIMIPTVLLMQSISKAVKDRKCYAGDFWDSLDEKVIGKPFDFLPVGFFKQIQTYEDGIKVKSEPWLHKTELDLMSKGFFKAEPVVVNGIKITKSIAQCYYVLLVSDIADMTPFPKVLRFVKTSAKAGKTLSTQIMRLDHFGAKPWAKVFACDSVSEAGDKGEYSVMSIKMGRSSTPEEVKIAERWEKILRTEVVTIHDGEELDADLTPSGSPERPQTVNADSNVNF